VTGVDDLIVWLHVQLDDDERVAREADGFYDDRDLSAELVEEGFDQCVGDLAARWDPARVLADIAAKRRILGLYEAALSAHRAGSLSLRNRTQDEAAVDVLGEAVLALAQPYSGRPGWRQEWDTPSNPG
jgi:hypothetical protein